MLRLITCSQCKTPSVFIGTVNADYDGNDKDLIQFAEMAAQRGFKATRQVYECQNPECGCRCRTYIVLPEDQIRPASIGV